MVETTTMAAPPTNCAERCPEARPDEFTVAETRPLSTIDPEVANP